MRGLSAAWRLRSLDPRFLRSACGRSRRFSAVSCPLSSLHRLRLNTALRPSVHHNLPWQQSATRCREEPKSACQHDTSLPLNRSACCAVLIPVPLPPPCPSTALRFLFPPDSVLRLPNKNATRWFKKITSQYEASYKASYHSTKSRGL